MYILLFKIHLVKELINVFSCISLLLVVAANGTYIVPTVRNMYLQCTYIVRPVPTGIERNTIQQI